MTMMTKQKPSGWMKLNQITDGFSMSRLELEEVQRCHDPIDFYRLFFSSDLLEEVAIQTNIYGRQKNRYMQKVKVNASKDPKKKRSVAEVVVIDLMKGFLRQGRCFCWYTSLQLAHRLLKKRTDLV
ncbi:hypothetical protein GCK32_006355, partial [Trichostrongylus colubriformis]